MQFNPCRTGAFNAFCVTLEKARGKPDVTEREFRDSWLDLLQRDETLYASGWYDPPPYGLSVLFASGHNPDRISFDSLRHKTFWPGDGAADWNGFLFAYSSSVSREIGIIGDFDITLYFGNDPALKEHYRACFEATDSFLQSIHPTDTSRKLFERSQEMFANAGLKNCVISTTDVTPLDLGHTYPILSKEYLSPFPEELSSEHKNMIRTARKFINAVTDWPLHEGLQFSIEPQLRSIRDPSLPQISFHYLLRVKDGKIQICRDIDALIRPCLES